MSDLSADEGIELRPPLANSSSPRDREPSEEEKLRQWQQERIERRLRGEYESATRRLGEVIGTSLHSPARIADIRVQGSTVTRTSFLQFLIQPHLHTPTPPSVTEGSLEDVLRRVSRISDTLERSDNFSSVQATLERSRSPLAEENDVDVVLKVRDRSRMFIKGSTETGNGEGSATATARVRNAFGGAETLEGSVSFGTTTRRAFTVRLEAPLTPSLKTRGELSVFQFDRDQTVFASSTESVTGVKASVRTQSVLGAHEFAYEAALRRIKGLSPAASVSIREAAGQTVKSSLSHTLVRDTRDLSTMSNIGHYFKLAQELAGLGGDAYHLKTETDASISRPLFPGTSISFSARAGSLIPLLGKPTLFNDRFQLGGPTSLRMFRHNGLGPKDGVDSIGGELVWAGGVSLISDIPRKEHWPLKTQLFLNAGRLDRLDLTKSLSETASSLLSRPAVSAGLGLIYRLDPVRLEVNFGVPLVASKSDRFARGFQMGIGVEFL